MARLAALSLICLLTPAVGLAQTAAPETPAADTSATAPADKIMLELNAAADTETGACRLTVVTTNRLPQGLKQAAWQIAIFDTQGVVQSLPVLDFGAMIAGKTKVAMFEIPDRRCDQIGRIVINDVAQCQGDDGADLRDACLSGLATQTRGDIDFGI